MKKLQLYIETSVWSHLFHDDAPESQAATKSEVSDETSQGP